MVEKESRRETGGGGGEDEEEAEEEEEKARWKARGGLERAALSCARFSQTFPPPRLLPLVDNTRPRDVREAPPRPYGTAATPATAAAAAPFS